MISTLAIAALVAGAISLIGLGLILEIIARQKQPVAANTRAGSVLFPTSWLPMIFVVLLGAGVIGYGLYLRDRAGNIGKAYGEDIAGLCQNAASVTPDERNLKTRIRPFKLVVMNLDGKRHSWHDRLPEEMRAGDRAEIDLVACVGDKQYYEVIESCDYVDSQTGGEFIIKRIQYYKNVYLLNPDTGQPAKILRAWGSAPEYCPDEIYGKDNLTCGEPSYSYFYEVLVDYAWYQ
ncbi:MAG: hypothetical protein EHM39_01655 [Chloroflexi bacterium]|nr:MAG: hypothetical protein EHM39_01655 [Chloroflexota bacterium]